MGKWHLAVCDSDENYTYRFVEFIQENKKSLFEVKAFTSIKGVIEYLKDDRVDVLLVSENEVLVEGDNLMIKTTIVLSDGDKKANDYLSINKFQPIDNIIREVMECTKSLDIYALAISENLNKNAEIIGIYSPLNRCYKTSLAVIMGMAYSKTKNVLYINLEEFSGFSKFLNIFEKKDLSDLMFFFKQTPDDFINKLYQSVNTLNGMDFINPVIFSKELRDSETIDWVNLIKFISLNSKYEIVILDMTNMLKDVFETIEICNQIYMPVLSDDVSVSKIKEFESYLYLMGQEKILDRIKKVKLPDIKDGEKGEKHFDSLLRGEFGEFVEKNLI